MVGGTDSENYSLDLILTEDGGNWISALAKSFPFKTG